MAAKVRVKYVPRKKSMPEQQSKRGFDAYNLDTPDAYTNNAEAIIGSSEIAIVFGHNVDPAGYASKPLVRLTMTHANFLMIMKYLNKRVALLNNLYENSLVTLDDIADQYPGVLSEEFSKMLQQEGRLAEQSDTDREE